MADAKRDVSKIPEAEIVSSPKPKHRPRPKQPLKKAKREEEEMNESMDEAVLYAKIPRGPLELFGLNTDVHASNDEEVIQLAVPSTYLNAFLIGQRGDTVRSLQFLVMSALKQKLPTTPASMLTLLITKTLQRGGPPT